MKTFGMLGVAIALSAFASPVTVGEAVQSNNTVGINLFNSVATRTPTGNKFFSPVSAYAALSMVYNGATHETAEQIEKVLAAQGMSRADLNTANATLFQALQAHSEFTLKLANSLWYRSGYTLKDDFKTRLTNDKSYGAKLDSFAQGSDATKINAWVKTATGGKIDSIVDNPIDANAALFLINATYFNADWAVKFKSGESKITGFQVTPSKSVDVATMHKGAANYQFTTFNGAQVIDLPYQGGAVTMVVVLPAKGQTGEDFAKGLTAQKWKDLSAALDNGPGSQVVLTMPKLTLDYNADLSATLRQLGMPRAFDRNEAEFDDMTTDPRGLYIKRVLQKTDLEVDEDGTTAAATTSVEMHPKSLISGLIDFNVNRPYFFAIREKKTGTILFLGSINQPEGGKLTPKKK